ncbi:MAG: prepilin-type N-terminal cleavage/methylation domain-containing protein [Candidatus Riflebacteria bacterium]|nr:prepilin-type N-terminal cleavage/methylation domain-containing protein [Candidatus Riflebacteria bacterium]
MRAHQLATFSHAGFTLIEVSISLLIMGLAISGLLDLLHWGQLRYTTIERDSRTRMAVAEIRRSVRKAIITGHLPLEVRDGKLVDTDSLSADHQSTQTRPGELAETLRIASIAVRPYDTQSVFVKLDLFDDLNHDGRIQSVERLPSTVWCFRLRDSQ